MVGDLWSGYVYLDPLIRPPTVTEGGLPGSSPVQTPWGRFNNLRIPLHKSLISTVFPLQNRQLSPPPSCLSTVYTGKRQLWGVWGNRLMDSFRNKKLTARVEGDVMGKTFNVSDVNLLTPFHFWVILSYFCLLSLLKSSSWNYHLLIRLLTSSSRGSKTVFTEWQEISYKLVNFTISHLERRNSWYLKTWSLSLKAFDCCFDSSVDSWSTQNGNRKKKK